MDRKRIGEVLRLLAGGRMDGAGLRLPPGLDPAEAAMALREAADLLGGPRPRERGARGRRLRAYIDGASRGNPGPAGAGVLIVDEEGTPLQELRRPLGTATNNAAEYQALLLALDAAAALGATVLEVFSDSQLLVRQLRGEYRVRDRRLQVLHAEARQRMAGLARFRITHVSRVLNREADRLANEAIDEAAHRATQRVPGGWP